MPHHFLVGGEKRKSLVSDVVLLTKRSHFAVPAKVRKAAVLHECGKFAAGCLHLFQMVTRDIAHSEQERASGIALFPHGLPNFSISLAPLIVRERPMQDIAVHIFGRQMIKRTGDRLLHLCARVAAGSYGKRWS